MEFHEIDLRHLTQKSELGSDARNMNDQRYVQISEKVFPRKKLTLLLKEVQEMIHQDETLTGHHRFQNIHHHQGRHHHQNAGKEIFGKDFLVSNYPY